MAKKHPNAGTLQRPPANRFAAVNKTQRTKQQLTVFRPFRACTAIIIEAKLGHGWEWVRPGQRGKVAVVVSSGG
jgi:hypothetical protein